MLPEKSSVVVNKAGSRLFSRNKKHGAAFAGHFMTSNFTAPEAGPLSFGLRLSSSRSSRKRRPAIQIAPPNKRCRLLTVRGSYFHNSIFDRVPLCRLDSCPGK
jgi:hypothetical protein